ncbi:MAG: 2Fe-2S iron-sulfur cluster binding domain-containing protein [Candidimonas sp.]|jgi:CDP-4-dehydro-6-deoxyglucose reductase
MTTSTVTVLNNGATFDADAGLCILDSGLAQGIALPHQCRGASCGQCKAHIERGTVNHGWSFGLAITDEEKEQGYCLMCQAKPTSEHIVLRTVQPMGDEARPVTELEGTIIALEQLTARVRRVVLRVPGAGALFRAGSYAELKLPGIHPDRVYSFSNSACRADQLEFLVALHPEGRASGYLHGPAKVGDAVDVKGPFGACRIPDGWGGVLGLAGGTGLAPVLSLFHAALDAGAADRFRLLFAVREDGDAFLLDRLMTLADAYPNFSYELVVAQGPSRLCGKTGLIDEYLYANVDTLQGWRVVAGGSPGFVTACATACAKLGVSADDISVDSFTDVSSAAALEVNP